MKFVALFVLCIAVANAEFSKEFQEKVLHQVTEVAEKCTKQEHASDDDIKELMQRKEPSRKEGKCLIACFHEEFTGVGKDGKITKEDIVKSLEAYKAENEALYNKYVHLLVDVCLPKVTSTDRCEAAAEMDHCYHENADDEIKKADEFLHLP